MRIDRYIVAIVMFLSLLGATAKGQEYQSAVCAGDTGVAYHVQGFENSTFEWTVEGGEIARHYNDSIIVNWGLVPGDYTITVSETSEFGCVGAMQSALVLVAGPEIDLGGDTYVCDGDAFEITAEGDFFSYLWNDGSTDPSYSTDQEGWISVEVTDSYGCALSDSLYLTVEDLPVVDLGNDTTLCGAESLLLDAGSDGIFYAWSTGDITQQITLYQGEQEIWVVVDDENACTNSDTILIGNCDVQFYFRDIPNAITTNGDGVNDFWNIEKLEGYSQAVVEIYDQWGVFVWKSEPGYPMGWDGRSMDGTMVPVDSYHYVIYLNNEDDERIIGFVTVIR